MDLTVEETGVFLAEWKQLALRCNGFAMCLNEVYIPRTIFRTVFSYRPKEGK